MPSAAPTRAHRGSTARTSRTSRHTGSSDGWLNWRLRSGRRPTGQSQSDECYTEGQRQTQAAGHLRRAGSGLHDSSAAGAGADLRSRGAGKQVRAARSTPWSTAKGCRCGSSSTSCDPGAGLVLTRYEGASRGPNGSGPMAAATPGRLKPRWQRYRCYAWRSPSGATT